MSVNGGGRKGCGSKRFEEKEGGGGGTVLGLVLLNIEAVIGNEPFQGNIGKISRGKRQSTAPGKMGG